jgi:hypothetical protein
VFAKDAPIDELKKVVSERILNAELDEHLGEERAEGNAKRQSPQRQLAEDDSDRQLEDAADDIARPGRHLRSEADRQIPAPLPRLATDEEPLADTPDEDQPDGYDEGIADDDDGTAQQPW